MTSLRTAQANDVDMIGFRSKNELFPLPALEREKLRVLHQLSRQQEIDLVESMLLRHRRVQGGESLDMTESLLDKLVQRGLSSNPVARNFSLRL